MHHRFQIHRSWNQSSLRMFVITCVVSTALTTGRAVAQGLPMIPDPVSTRALMNYADRLDLSQQQRLALLPLHDAYLLRFGRLRDGDIQHFEDDLLGLASRINPMNLQIPPRDELEGLMRQYNQLLEKVKKVDRTLFTSMETILTEEQLPRIGRVRRARERSMYSEVTLGIGGEFNPGASIDLNDYLQNIDLAIDVREQFDSIMRGYEMELLERTKKLHEEIERGFTIILDTIDELGLRDMTIAEISQLGENEGFIQTAMSIFDEASRPFQKATSELGELNLRTYRRVSKLLESRQQKKFRQRYFKLAYRRAFNGIPSTTEGFTRTLKLTELTTEQRNHVELEQDLFAQRIDPLLEETASLIEKSRKFRTVQDFQNENEGIYDERIQKLTARRDQVIEAANRRIKMILGEELSQAFARDMLNVSKQQIHTVRSEDGRTIVEISGKELAGGDSTDPIEHDPVLPPPIPVGLLDPYASKLGLDDTQRPILDSLYDDYRESYQSLIETPPDPARTSESDDPEVVEYQKSFNRARHRQSQIIGLRVIDDEFFGNLSLLLPGDDSTDRLNPIRIARRCDACLHSLERLDHWHIDLKRVLIRLLDIVEQIDPTPDERIAIETVLYEHDEQTVDSLTKLVDVTLQVARLQALRDVMARQQSKSEETIHRRLQGHYRTASSLVDTLHRRNRQTFTRMTGLMSENSRWRLVQAYNEVAYPAVYDDRKSAVTIIDTALGLEDLSPAQLERISGIAMDFRSSYYELSDQMVEIKRRQDEFKGFQGTIPIDLIRREIRGERLQFRRNEASARARARLQMVLTDEQARRIGADRRGDDESS